MPQSRWIQFHEQKLIDVKAQISVSTTKAYDFSPSFLSADRASGEMAQQVRVPAALPEIQVWSQQPHTSLQPSKTLVVRDLTSF